MAARGSKLAWRIGAGVISTVFGGAALLAGRRIYGSRVIKRKARSLALPSCPGRFEPRLVDGLPEPVQRYFLHALANDAPLEPAAHFGIVGDVRFSAQESFRSAVVDALIAPPRGFVFRATVGAGRNRIDGYDWLDGDDAGAEFYAIGALPIHHRRGRDVHRCAAGRLAAWSIFVPASLLPSRGVRWEVEGPNTIRATSRIAGEPRAVTLELDDCGRVRGASLLCWCDQTADHRYSWIPYGIDVDAERTFEGITIPSSIRAAYWYGTDRRFDHYRADIDVRADLVHG